MESIETSVADRFGRVLAPVVDAGVPVEDASDLPKSVSLVALTGQDLANSAESQVVRWRENQSIIDRRDGAPPTPLKHLSLIHIFGRRRRWVARLSLRTFLPPKLAERADGLRLSNVPWRGQGTGTTQ